MPIWPNISRWQWVLISEISYPYWSLESFTIFTNGTSPFDYPKSSLWFVLYCLAFWAMDKDFLRNPHTWEVKSITRFMVWMGLFLLPWYFDLHFTLFYHCTHDDRSYLCSWSRFGRRLYCLVSDRLVLSSLCGHKLWLSICCVPAKIPFYKVVQLG